MKKSAKSQLISPEAKEILELALTLDHAANINDILTSLSKKITKLMGAQGIRIFDYDVVGNEIFTKTRLFDAYVEIRFPVSDESVAGYTALKQQVVALDDVRDANELKKYPGMRYDARWEGITGVKVLSLLSIPLVNEGSVLTGIIQLVNLEGGGQRSEEEIDLLKQVGKIVGSAIFHLDLRQQRSGKFDLLLEKNIITQDELNKATKITRQNLNDPLKGDVVNVLLEHFKVGRKDMAASLSRHYLTDFLSFDETRVLPTDLLKTLSLKFLINNFVVPVALEGDTVSLLMDDPQNTDAIAQIKSFIKTKRIKLYVGFRKDILKYFRQFQGLDLTEEASFEDLEIETEDFGGDEDGNYNNILNENAPLIIQIVNKLILEAYEMGVSDIHIEPALGKKSTAVRFRLDGACFKHTEIPANLSHSIINRIKIMSRLKLEERRFPQSGKISIKHGNKNIELRVEVTPTVGGKEDIVLRMLTSAKFLSLDVLNLSDSDYAELDDIIHKPYGMVLVVGPTGSGKTTTLHAILNQLNVPEKKIWTVEDPVEIRQKDLRQVQVNFGIKPEPYDFAKALRSFLRADPDIIMVGEIRDLETATIAIEASLTGHLVLSTLHTNSAPETATRLIEMGIVPMNIADGLLGILAQRLVRTLCANCKEEYSPSDSEIQLLKKEYRPEYVNELNLPEGDELRLFRPAGCEQCNGSGFKGRTGIYELLKASKTVKKMVVSQASASDIMETAISEGMRTLKMDGIKKVLAGTTTLKEVKSVCFE